MIRRRPPHWIAYVAVVLMLGHASLSGYWAAGGTLGLGLLSVEIQEMAAERPADFIALVWGVALLKLAVGLLALAIARGWPVPLPGRMIKLVVWGTGVVLTLYGAGMMLLLVVAGFIFQIAELERSFWAYLLLWAPLWSAIGISYLLLGMRISKAPTGAVTSGVASAPNPDHQTSSN